MLISLCISHQIKEGIDLFIVDEVGKMELYSSSFFPAVLRVLDSNIPFLATIPIPKFGRDIPGGTLFSFNILVFMSVLIYEVR